MSQLIAPDSRMQEVRYFTTEVDDARRLNPRCRIPQRLPAGRARAPTAKGKVFAESMTRCTIRAREEAAAKHMHPATSKSVRQEKNSPGFKKTTIMGTKKNDDNTAKTRIVLKNTASQRGYIDYKGLPDQESIKKHEELEIQDLSDLSQLITEISEVGHMAVTEGTDSCQIQFNFQEKIQMFEKFKDALHERQNALLEVYATLKDTQERLTASGQVSSLPLVEDLQILNVAKIPPEKLLRLCTGSMGGDKSSIEHASGARDKEFLEKLVDMNKLYSIPTKLVATCEQTLQKRKEIIDWFYALQNEKGISATKLTKKLNEFNAENEVLNNSLQIVKAEFLKEINEMVDYLRKGLNDTVSLQLRTEELTYEISELNSKNADLRKQLHTAEHLKSQNTRHKIEELEKELREEKNKKAALRDRLSRAEGQIKIGSDRASQLEAALEQARSQIWGLERTVQQLHEQNQKLQADFDCELNKLTESIKDNTEQLEEIADAREKLQNEKEDLERRLQDLSDRNNESIESLKAELKQNVMTLLEMEISFAEKNEEVKNLTIQINELSSKLKETEISLNDAHNQLEDKAEKLGVIPKLQAELDATKQDLNKAHKEVEEYRKRILNQGETIREIERNFKETMNLEKNLKSELRSKEERISELENTEAELEQQLKESESKMKIYQEQLTALKEEIVVMQKELGEFQNVSQLQTMMNEQRTKLLETTQQNKQLSTKLLEMSQQNNKLSEALQKREQEYELQVQQLAMQESLLEERVGVIKMLSDREEEQSKIIKLLRNNVEMRTHADNELNQQLMEKSAEIESLVTNVETRKQQISQLEKIIVTLEDQLRKVCLQRRKDQDKIALLEDAVSEFENIHLLNKRSVEGPAENLDNLISILEDELGSSFDPMLKHKQQDSYVAKNKYLSNRGDKYEIFDDENDKVSYVTEDKSRIRKKPMDDEQPNGDSLDRKKAITNMDAQKMKPFVSVYASQQSPRENLQSAKTLDRQSTTTAPKTQYFTRNLQYFAYNLRDEKKCKMFKFAGHKICP